MTHSRGKQFEDSLSRQVFLVLFKVIPLCASSIGSSTTRM